MTNDNRPRVLILGGKPNDPHPAVGALSQYFRVDVFENMDDAMAALRRERYNAVFAGVGDFLPLERGLVGQQSSLVLNTIGEGVCIVGGDGVCSWSNSRMQGYSPEVIEQVKQKCYQAIADFCHRVHPGSDANVQRGKKYSFKADGDRYYEVMISPVVDDQGAVRQVVAVVWEVTSGRRLQQKIDAIDAAGRELANLESDAIGKLSPGERLQLLQDKVISFCKDLLHFEHFAIRALDKRTNKLELVISQGFPLEARDIDLYAQPEGNGISGYVAATGRSYICHDTEKDPRYELGIEHAKSSLTVPMRLHHKIVGVFNIESERVGGFNEDDRQFAEIFGRYVALGLNILDLLVVERYTTTGQLADNVVQEMAQPLNDIATEAQVLMEEFIGHHKMHEGLKRILEHVGSLREAIRGVAAGPRAVLGAGEVVSKPNDPLLSGKKVLVADDEQNLRDTIGDVLRRHGCECTISKDGYEAINMIERHDYDLVISDIRLPHRNGYEIFAAARRCSEHMPVILMTGFGYDSTHSIVRADQEGLSGVLYKPFQVEALLEEVRKALAKKQAVHQ